MRSCGWYCNGRWANCRDWNRQGIYWCCRGSYIVAMTLIAKCHLMSNTQLIVFNGRTFCPKGLCQLLTRSCKQLTKTFGLKHSACGYHQLCIAHQVTFRYQGIHYNNFMQSLTWSCVCIFYCLRPQCQCLHPWLVLLKKYSFLMETRWQLELCSAELMLMVCWDLS